MAFYTYDVGTGMVLSEDKGPEDKKKLKNGVVGVAVLLILGSLAPVIIQESTGVDLTTLCGKDDTPISGTDPPTCLDVDNPELSKQMLSALGYVSTIVAVVAFVGLIIVAVKY